MPQKILQLIKWKNKNKTRLSGYANGYYVDYNITDNGNIINIYKCFNEEIQYKIMVGFIKK